MSVLKGEVLIKLAGCERTLKPSLQAFTQLSAQYGNHGDLHRKLMTGDVQSMIRVLRYGLQVSDAEAKKLPDMVFRTGAHELVDPLVDYAFKLFNNGMSAEEWLASQTASEGGDAASDENPLLNVR